MPSSQESTPSHHSDSSINHSHNSSSSRCTCNCHNHNSYGSASHLEPPKTLPLARYGYPDADNYPYHYHRQYSEEQYGYVPELKVIPPTPNSGETPEPTQESAQAYASTPVSGEVAVNIATYLKHKDCPDQENCPTCQLINRQFQHLLTRYEHAHSKDTKREKLQSTSEVNAEELIMSSNEDSSTDAEVLTKPEGPRRRVFTPLKVPLVSGSELAVTSSGHNPSPRRAIASPTKLHPKPSAPQSPTKGDRPPSSKSSDNSRPGSDGSFPLYRSKPQDPLQPSMHIKITLPSATSQQTDL